MFIKITDEYKLYVRVGDNNRNDVHSFEDTELNYLNNTIYVLEGEFLLTNTYTTEQFAEILEEIIPLSYYH